MIVDAWNIELKRTAQEATLLLIGRPFGLSIKISLPELEQLAAQLTQEATAWQQARDSNYYAVLGVSRQATADEIQNAYRNVAKQVHPDTSPEHTGDAMQQLNAAYEILSDPEKRRQYDQTTV